MGNQGSDPSLLITSLSLTVFKWSADHVPGPGDTLMSKAGSVSPGSSQEQEEQACTNKETRCDDVFCEGTEEAVTSPVLEQRQRQGLPRGSDI